MQEIHSEDWRGIPGRPGYQASSRGSIRSIDRLLKCSHGATRLLRGKVLCKPGNRRVRICRENLTVYDLVSLAFPDGDHSYQERPKSKYGSVDDAKIRDLHATGIASRTIASTLGVPHWVVDRRVKAIGLSPNGAPRGARVVDGDQQQCSACGTWAEIDSYPFGRSGPDKYRLTFCYACKTTRANKRRNSGPRAYLIDRCAAMRFRAGRSGTEFNVDAEYLIGLYERQDGKCFYTDVALVIAVGQGQRDRNA